MSPSLTHNSFFLKSSLQEESQGEAESWEEFESILSSLLQPPIPLPTIVEPSLPPSLLTSTKPTEPIVSQKGRWKELVYSRKKHSHGSDNHHTQQCQESEPIPTPIGSFGSSKTNNNVDHTELNMPSSETTNNVRQQR